ncbi:MULTISPECIES: hypothetical protein [unclassified Streptomyces]|uniref:hypothetical protein n=1 Tax=unclassified Streptomyces TaxID=2593676 RepID=UPI00115FB614|nr:MULTISPECIES: hypothetical protein [unclassified Streptomyces]
MLQQRAAAQASLTDLKRREQAATEREASAVQREAQGLARERAAVRRAVDGRRRGRRWPPVRWRRAARRPVADAPSGGGRGAHGSGARPAL